MKSKICLILCFMLLAGVSAGCKNDNKPAENVTITVVSSYGESDGNRVNFVNAYKAYEEASGNTISDRSGISNEEWKSGIITDFQNFNEPDILFFFTGSDADYLVNSEKVVAVSEIKKEFPDYASNMKEHMMPVSTADGRQYAVPVNGYWEGLYINKKVLADCGIEIPGLEYTWEQFIRDCETIKEKGYIPIAFSAKEVPHYWFEYCTFNNGSVSAHSVLPLKSNDEAGTIWNKGISDIRDLYERGFFPGDTLTIADSEANKLMTQNEAVFMIDGSWKMGWFEENAENIEDFAVTYVPAKGERHPTEIIGGLSMGYYITRKAWNDPAKRKACVEFVMAMTTDEVVSSFGALSITALKNGTINTGKTNSFIDSALTMTQKCTSVVSAVQDQLTTKKRNILFGEIVNILNGSITADEAIKKCLAG